ncbi:MAG: ATP-NAD kinase family protein [Candidatus Hodarchaeales archaeon]|jgi:predicted polyphosphate/ATP-dependent NAD kinase
MERKEKNLFTVGFLLNPIAGMGGKFALKGTDGEEILEKALALGAEPITPEIARKFLEKYSQNIQENISFLVAPAPMGYQIFETFPNVPRNKLKINVDSQTTSADTIQIVRTFCNLNVDLILFLGGDGTSVDIYNGLKKEIPILGIPSGVKTYGEVFSHNIEESISILLDFAFQQITHTADILDLDEEEYRKGNLKVEVKGQVLVPNYPQFFQQTKSPSFSTSETEETNKRIADYLIHKLKSDENKSPVILCPGSTFNQFSKMLNIERSLLGVDVIFEESLIIKDATEFEIYEYCFKGNFSNPPIIIITPIGSMGYLFGRGNHQLSPRILKEVPKENIWIVASHQKLNHVQGSVLRVDTKDQEVDTYLTGYFKVIVDRQEYKMIKVVH